MGEQKVALLNAFEAALRQTLQTSSRQAACTSCTPGNTCSRSHLSEHSSKRLSSTRWRCLDTSNVTGGGTDLNSEGMSRQRTRTLEKKTPRLLFSAWISQAKACDSVHHLLERTDGAQAACPNVLRQSVIAPSDGESRRPPETGHAGLAGSMESMALVATLGLESKLLEGDYVGEPYRAYEGGY